MKKTDVEKILTAITQVWGFQKKKGAQQFQCLKQFHRFDENFYGYFDEEEEVDFCCMEFKVREIPKWLFGLWITEKHHKDEVYFEYKFFGADERDIDKFKPSHVENLYSGTAYLCDDNAEYNYYIDGAKLLKYVYQHRVMANYREIWGVDYNLRYVPAVFACLCLGHHRFKEWARAKWNNLIERKTVKYYCKVLHNDFPNDDIWSNVDNNRSPRTELFVVIPEYDEEIDTRMNSLWHEIASPKVWDISQKWAKIGKYLGINVYFPDHVGQSFMIMSQADFQTFKENTQDYNQFRLLKKGEGEYEPF